jgi:hypothetical protein
MSTVVIGMDRHKRSATIGVMAGDETVPGGGRFGADAAGYRAMLAEAGRWPQRTWAVEGCQGTGAHIAGRLVPMASTWRTCRRSCQPVRGCSLPGRAARPTPPTPTRLPWSPRG